MTHRWYPSSKFFETESMSFSIILELPSSRDDVVDFDWSAVFVVDSSCMCELSDKFDIVSNSSPIALNIFITKGNLICHVISSLVASLLEQPMNLQNQ